ncbi:MAG TPA: competence/damage-inducible protein A [Bryobacteraceae bacterium]|nr:competence/damage-inducible protein A [Bryobacteraceae bacterium]
MQAEIIAAGSEMLTPERVDTNSLWLTQRLNDLGVEVTQKSIIGDDRDRLADAVRAAIDRSPIIVLTGGLGPTEDDVTREAVAQALMRRLLYSDELMTALEARFARMSRKMSANNRRQAFLIEGARILPNPNGTAAGQWIDLPGRVVMLLPGPPRELEPMFTSHCTPLLAEMLPERSLCTRVYRVAGMPESELDQLIAPVYMEYSNPATTILAKAGDIQIHLRASGESAAEAQALADEVGSKIQALLGDRIYSEDGAPLEVALGRLLKRRGATLAVAESCTGGLLGGRITDAPGASEWFLGGFQVYGKTMKTRLLGLNESIVNEHGVVSEAVACAMADSARDRTGATYALSVTGEAGPESASPGIEPGTVWIGLATPEGVSARQFHILGDRVRVRSFAVQTALNLLRLSL